MMKKKVRGIARDTLHFILEASRSSEPNEFAGLLSVEGDIISDVIILPGTESSRMSALVRLYMLPNMSVAGSAHSHPSGLLRPSEPDILFFSRTGDYNIIVGPPYLIANLPGDFKKLDTLVNTVSIVPHIVKFALHSCQVYRVNNG